MAAPESRECAGVRALLPGYLLDTLGARERLRVETHLEPCAGCRAALEETRARLEVVDALPAPSPPGGLADRTLVYVEEQSAKPARAFPFGWLGYGFVRPLAVVAPILVLFVAVGVIMLPALSRARDSARMAACQGNMKQLAIIFMVYSEHSPDGLFPPPALQDGVWIFDLRTVYPRYLTDLNMLICPSDPEGPERLKKLRAALEQSPPDFTAANRLAAQTLCYFGVDVENQEALKALLDVQRRVTSREIEEGLQLEGFTFPRLQTPGKSGDDPATIPVVFEIGIQRHRKGINVLYQDGHVACLPYPGTFPSVPEAAAGN